MFATKYSVVIDNVGSRAGQQSSTYLEIGELFFGEIAWSGESGLRREVELALSGLFTEPVKVRLVQGLTRRTSGDPRLTRKEVAHIQNLGSVFKGTKLLEHIIDEWVVGT